MAVVGEIESLMLMSGFFALQFCCMMNFLSRRTNLTIMAPITCNSYYAFRNMSAIMNTLLEIVALLQGLIMSKKALLRETKRYYG